MRMVTFLGSASVLVLAATQPARAQQAAGQSIEASGTPTAATNQAPPAESAPAPAADASSADIIVTADRSSRTLQKTPIAVSVVSGAEIAAQGRKAVDDVLQNVPATVVQATAKGFAVAIRGLGLDLPPQNGQASVSQNFDGVYNFLSESNSVGFYDLDRVEVLRGPQGTLYGRNASGGVVNVISADPKLGQFSGYGTLEGGNYNLIRGEAAVNAPVSDTIALRAAFASINRDGYLNNGHDDNKSISGRLKLLYKPSDALSLLLGAEYAKLGGKGPGQADVTFYKTNDPFRTTDTGLGDRNFRSWKFWSLLSANIGPGALTVLPSYQTARAHSIGAFGGNFRDAGDPAKARQKSIEVRYSALAGERLQWGTGYYHYDSYNKEAQYSGPCQGEDGSVYFAPYGFTYKSDTQPVPGRCRTTPVHYYATDYPTIRKTTTDAFFGQVTYPVFDQLRVIGGARYTWDRTSSTLRDSNACSPFSPFICVAGAETTTIAGYVRGKAIDRHFDYRAGVEFDLAPRSLLYGTIASGHRTGGFSDDNSQFRPEKLVSYEVGVKNRFLDNPLTVNADVFYYDYKQYQFAFFGFDTNGNFVILLKNVPTAREYGAELESQFQLTQADNINLSVVYLNSKLTADSTVLNLVTFNTENLNGSPFPHTPKWSIKGGYSHVFDLGDWGTITPRADVRYLTGQFIYPVGAGTSYSAEQGQRRHVTGDLSLIYSSAGGRWSASAYVKNVNDKLIKTAEGFGYLQYAPPRTYGGSVTVKF